MTATDVLWGGQLKAVMFDHVEHRLALQVDVVDSGGRAVYDLTCAGVSELRFTNAIPEPWSYAEVTEVHTSRTAAGKWMLELMLWSEDSELVCTCDSLSVTQRP